MAFTYRALRSLVSKRRPPGGVYRYGELYVNLADVQIGVIDENGLPQDLLAITFFKNLASYKEGDHIIYQGKIYIAKQDITGPKNFDPDDWSVSGLDLSLGDYDEKLPYAAGTPAFFPGDNCFLQATVDIPANTPFDESMWENICQGKGTGGGGYSVGDVVTTLHLLDPVVQTERRLVILHGQELPRVGEYADLFAEWGTQFGAGNGASTFNVPDMRGYVPRGVDESLAIDPDAGTRKAQNLSGTNVGAMGGTVQDDMVGKHKHSFRLDEPANDWTGNVHGYHRGMVYNWHPLQHTYDYGGEETRMKNIGVHWYVKY